MLALVAKTNIATVGTSYEFQNQQQPHHKFHVRNNCR